MPNISFFITFRDLVLHRNSSHYETYNIDSKGYSWNKLSYYINELSKEV